MELVGTKMHLGIQDLFVAARLVFLNTSYDFLCSTVIRIRSRIVIRSRAMLSVFHSE